MKTKNRIIRTGNANVSEICANPKNWRHHPKTQTDAVAANLQQIGWLKRIIINERTGTLIDGHLRLQIARDRNEKTIPADYVDLTPDEEDAALATLDATTTLARKDSNKLNQLIKNINSTNLTALADFKSTFEPPTAEPALQPPPRLFQILITCKNESEHQNRLTEFQAAGYNCRALIA